MGKKILSLVLSLIMIFAGLSLSIRNAQALEINQDEILENVVLDEDIYVNKNTTLTLNGDVTINGDMYVLGTVNNNGNLTITGTLNCFHYNSMMSAGDYDYGYFYNSGQAKINSLNVTDSWLSSINIPENPGNDYTGKCGRNITYVYDSITKTLTLSGSGVVYDDFSFQQEISQNTKIIRFIDYTSLEIPLFSNFVQIESIIIPNSVENFQYYNEFSNCAKLSQVVLSNNMKEIPYGAFSGCVNLKKIDIPKNIQVIGWYAFNDCSSLEEIIVPEGVKELVQNVFSGCVSLKKVSLPSSLENISCNVFQDCTSLKEIQIPSKVMDITYKVFQNCINLEKVIIPKSTSNIDDNVFDYSDKVTIYGAKGSYAEEYANRIGIPFKECEHQFDNGVIAENQPCNQKRIKTYTCKLCDQTKEEYIPAIEHQWSDWITAQFPTCTEEGLEMIECNICHSREFRTIPTTNHNWSDWIIENNSTCTQMGLERRICNTCLTEEIREIPMCNHVKGNWMTIVEATCITNGKQELRCSNCNTLLDTKIVKAAGHQWNIEYTVDKEATTKQEGQKSIHCSVCDAIKEDSIEVIPTIVIPIASISLNAKSHKINKGTRFSIGYVISPSNTTFNKKVTWTSSDTAVAVVDQNGIIRGVGGGTAIITVTTINGKSDTIEVVVDVPITSGRLNKNTATVKKGKTLQLNVTFLPENHTGKEPEIRWSSDNKKVATVDSNGKVTAVGPGQCDIFAVYGDNELYCQLTVPYTITYKLNGGKNNKSNPSTYYGRNIKLKNPTRKGYTFSGWYPDSKFKKKKITSFSSGNKTLYAKWTKVKVSKAKTPKLTNVKGKKLKITYSATSGAKGYQIQYCTNKKFKKATSKLIKGRSVTYKLSKKTYYVRVRAYKLDSTGAKVYGSWSSIKSIKIKK